MNKSITMFKNLPTPVGSLDAYLHRINQIPVLTAEEEHELATRLHDENDVEAARMLVLSHLRFVASIARGYLGYGLALGDLIQEGNIGLMKAVKRFDPHVGVRLVTFAVHWIKSEIHEFIIRNWRMVKIATTKAQRKLFFNLRSQKKRLGWFTAQEVADVAKELKVKPSDVLEMEARLNAHDAAFDLAPDEDEESAFAPEMYLEDNRYNPEMIIENQESSGRDNDNLYAALSDLDERSQDIIKQRWLNKDKATLHDLAAKYSVSAERVRQLEVNAMKKLRLAVLAA